jgi:hypothetical protein
MPGILCLNQSINKSKLLEWQIILVERISERPRLAELLTALTSRRLPLHWHLGANLTNTTKPIPAPP